MHFTNFTLPNSLMAMSLPQINTGVQFGATFNFSECLKWANEMTVGIAAGAGLIALYWLSSL
jgi:hypothetical protein